MNRHNASGKEAYRRSYGSMKTPIKHGMTTRSRTPNSSFLEIFIMDKHRTRLNQERANLARRIGEIDHEIAALNKQINNLKKEVGMNLNTMSGESVARGCDLKTVKSMPLTY